MKKEKNLKTRYENEPQNQRTHLKLYLDNLLHTVY